MLRHQYGISVDAQQILGVVEGLQSDHQPQQNRGTVPACSKQPHPWSQTSASMTRRWQMSTASSTWTGQHHLKRRIPDKEITSRISKASQALGRLQTKGKVYRAIVLTALQCECETWTRYRRRVKQLETFHMRALRSILGMCWQDRITNLEVLDRAECTSIETLLIKAQLRWVGQIIRMDDPLMPRQLLYGELVRVTRTLKKIEASDSDRSQWCSPTLTAPTSFEDDRVTDSWQQPMNEAKEHSLLISQQRSSSVPPAPDSALPDWVCRATRESVDDHTTRSPQHAVFFGHDGQPPNKHL